MPSEIKPSGVKVGDLVDTGDVFFVCTRRNGPDLFGVIVGGIDADRVSRANEQLMIDGLCWDGTVDVHAHGVAIISGRPDSETAHL